MTTALPAGLSAAQQKSLDLAFRPNHFGEVPKVCLWDGAVRAGKTVVSALAFLIACQDPPAGGAIVVIGRTRDSIARNLFDVLQDPSIFGELAQYVQYTPGASTAKIYGKVVHVLGASDVKAEMVLRGLTVALAYVDELTLISEPFWKQLLARMSPPGARIFATTNPDGPQHWAHKSIIKKVHELGYKRFRFRLPANEWLMVNNPAYVRQIEREYTGLWRRRFLDGEWVQAEGAVYEEWNQERHTVAPGLIPRHGGKLVGVALDYGTQHPTRAYAIWVADDYRFKRTPTTYDHEVPQMLYTVAEFAPETNLSPNKQSAQFRTWLQQVEREWGQRPEWVFVDPAAKHFRVQLFEDGLTTAPAHNSKDGGIKTLNSLLAIDRIAVSLDCPELIDHIPGYMWDPKAAKRGEDEPIKEDDDEVDAWRYAVYSTRRFWRDDVPVLVAADHAPGMHDDEDYSEAA